RCPRRWCATPRSGRPASAARSRLTPTRRRSPRLASSWSPAKKTPRTASSRIGPGGQRTSTASRASRSWRASPERPVDLSAIAEALVGGVLIGAGASLLLLFNGRLAGVAGIVAGLLQRWPGERGWRAACVIGLVGGGIVVR